MAQSPGTGRFWEWSRTRSSISLNSDDSAVDGLTTVAFSSLEKEALKTQPNVVSIRSHRRFHRIESQIRPGKSPPISKAKQIPGYKLIDSKHPNGKGHGGSEILIKH